jgi:hypothetical protein
MKTHRVYKAEILYFILQENDNTNTVWAILTYDWRRKTIVTLSRIYYVVNYLPLIWKFGIARCTKYKAFGKSI